MGHFHHFNSLYYGYPLGVPAVVLGLVLLIFGRKLFWLFIGAIGFVSGLHIAAYSLYGQPYWMVLLAGLFAGIIGAVFAIFLQKTAVIVGGFFAGGYLVLNLINIWGWHIGRGYWLISLIAGIVGAIVAAAYFDWALIILSSLTGAIMITQSIPLGPTIKGLILIVLIFLVSSPNQTLCKKIFRKHHNKQSSKEGSFEIST